MFCYWQGVPRAALVKAAACTGTADSPHLLRCSSLHAPRRTAQPSSSQPRGGGAPPPAKPSTIASSITPGPSSAAAAATPGAKAAARQFVRQRNMLARQLYAHWNQLVFGGRLDADLPLVWNPRLLSTAGQVRAAPPFRPAA
jgi:hypothetical protein